MISKACYKPHTIFLLHPVKDSYLCIDIKEIIYIYIYIYLYKQFILVVDLPFYLVYIPDSASSFPSLENLY